MHSYDHADVPVPRTVRGSIASLSIQTASFITRVLLKTHDASNYAAPRCRLHQSVVFQHINKLANGMKLATDQALHSRYMYTK